MPFSQSPQRQYGLSAEIEGKAATDNTTAKTNWGNIEE
tara:strand:+ start:1082 stop:1195 length:114 start_codon:yes stop_codon:yes gene_type:complete